MGHPSFAQGFVLLSRNNLALLLHFDPLRNPRIQYIERQRAAIQNLIVKFADIVSASKLLLARSRSLRISSSPSL